MTVWTAYRATDFLEPLTLKDSAGTIFDVENHTVTAEVRDKVEGKLLVAATVTVVNAPGNDGQVNIGLTNAQVDALGDPGRKYIDIRVLRDSDSYVFRSATVALDVKGKVTE